VVPRGGSRAFLAPYPVETLTVPDLPDVLRRLGLRTLGAFAQLPQRDVLARFGPDGARAHRLARGLDDRPLAARPAAPELAVQTELDPPVERVDIAAFAAKALAEELHAGLARRGLACTRVAIEAQTEHGEQLTRLWRHEGVLTPAAIADRVRWQLDGWLSGSARAHAGAPAPGKRPPAPKVIGTDPEAPAVRAGQERPTAGIVLLRLVPDEVMPYGGMQLGLWGGMGEADERAGRVLARVQGMLGPDRVLTAVLDGGRDPGDQVRLVAWGDERVPDRPTEPPWPGRLPAPSPATVLPAPVPAEVTDEAGVPVGVTERFVVTGRPVRLALAGRPPVEIAAWAGPWPADERWWDPPTASSRARFQLVGTDGTAWLVTRDRTGWHLEATYD
jgi:protein ImuB